MAETFRDEKVFDETVCNLGEAAWNGKFCLTRVVENSILKIILLLLSSRHLISQHPPFNNQAIAS
jgi:hypothetical protein